MKRTVFGIAAAILLCASAYAFVRYTSVPSQNASSVFASSSSAQPLISASTSEPAALGSHREPPAGYKEYYDVAYRFSLFYPDDLSVATYGEGGGARTITFQNPATVHGFQIFVAPYNALQVTEAQFKKDEPSGARVHVQSVSIDGVTGASFYSTNAALGDTAEMWFVHGGYLYEATTLTPLGSWLFGIMQSWKFI